MRGARRPWIPLAAAALALTPGAARAAGGDAAAAEFVFQQAMALMEKRAYAEACPRFEESQRLDPGVGTLLYLADCYEKVGRTATAWATFREAEDAARSAGQRSRERSAKKRAAALAPRLSKLTVSVPAAMDVPGFEVRRDGHVIARVLWGTATPVDPGAHAIEASAPSKATWKMTITVPPSKDPVEVVVPVLGDAPVKPASAPLPPAAPARPALPLPRLAALIAGGAGVLAMGVSVGIGGAARSRFNESAPHCQGNLCDQEGVDVRADAKSTARACTIVFAAGASAVAIGAALWFTAPLWQRTSGQSGVASVRLGLGIGGGVVEGRY